MHLADHAALPKSIIFQVHKADIREEIVDTTMVSCHFKCTKSTYCKGWATFGDVTVGERTNCYILDRVGRSNVSPSSDKKLYDMYVVSLVSC